MDFTDTVCIDFETFYSKEYSLTLARYNTSEYIRDPQFLIHGVGIQCHGFDPYWVVGHEEALRELEELELTKRPVVAHNMAFDGFILHHHAAIHPLYYLDTLSMSRAALGHHVKHNLNNVAQILGLGAKTQGLEDTKGLRILTPGAYKSLGDYCMNDVDLCFQIFWKLRPYIPPDELDLIDLTLRMFCEPVLKVDLPIVTEELQAQKDHKRLAVSKTPTDTDTLMSNNRFAELLKALGVEPPLKISLRTGKEAYAFAKTDKGFKELLKHENEDVRQVAEARMAIKTTINETRAARLLAAGAENANLPVALNYAGAHTFRWSGGNKLNLQNLPRGGALRQAICSPAGHAIVVYDLSQIEARITAWLADQADLLAAFRALDAGTGEDVYRLMAAKVLHKPIDLVSKADRHLGKVCTLGMGFGMGWRKLITTLAIGFMGPPVFITENQAASIVASYRSAVPNIVQLWDRLTVLLERMAHSPKFQFPLGPLKFAYRMVELPCKLALKYPGLSIGENGLSYMTRSGRSSIWGGTMLENCIAENTKVLTDSGWKLIQNVTIEDKVHDGLEFVTHGGLLFKSKQTCVVIDGVAMTPDHEVLTDEGWQAAQTSPKPYRPDLRTTYHKPTERNKRRVQPVYDLLNCGPRQRFVVLGNTGPFIVHNCAQALARCVIGEQMLELSRMGYKIATMTHDEIVAVVPTPVIEQAMIDFENVMSKTPVWAPGLPLAVKGWSNDRYIEP